MDGEVKGEFKSLFLGWREERKEDEGVEGDAFPPGPPNCILNPSGRMHPLHQL